MTHAGVHITIVFLALSFSTLALADSPAKPRIVASLERFGCEGSCPAYKLTIFDDGRVEWVGRYLVKQRGAATAKLSSAELAAVAKAFAATSYFDVAAKHDCGDDAPVAHTFYDDGKRKRLVMHDSICDRHADTPERRTEAARLTVLETAIDQITGSERWVGTAEERAALLKAGKL